MVFDYGGERIWPKVGEEKTVHIKSSRKIDQFGHKDNFKGRTGKDFGYHYEVELQDGKKAALGAWKLFFAFRDHGVQDGDKVLINHPEAGRWEIKILERGSVFHADNAWKE